MNSSAILGRLRHETLTEHRALENSLNLMDQSLSVVGYVSTLQRFHSFVGQWEMKAAQACPLHLTTFFEQRWRAHRISDDLRFFGAELLKDLPQLPAPAKAAGFWGSMYVMEGSTLGGQLISRHLETVLGLQNGEGYSYFLGYGPDTGAKWKEFCKILSRETEDLDPQQVVAAARLTFQRFHAWLDRTPSETVFAKPAARHGEAPDHHPLSKP